VRLLFVLALFGGCGFRPAIAQTDAVTSDDAAVDAPPDARTRRLCPADAHLRLCYSFEQSPLPTTLPNEGAATVDASLTNVTRIQRGEGGAALLDTTSIIHVPTTADVANIQAIEVWYRADADPANTLRFGLVDSNIIPPNISLFVARVDPTHELRCGLGSASGVFDATLVVGTWYYVACVCDAGVMTMYVGGAPVGQVNASGCTSGGAIASAGLTIGSNNNGGPAGVNDWLIGAVDGVRLWDVTLSAETIAATAVEWP
jgi:hypothetical protein